MLASLYLSFTDYSLIQAPEWIGLDNYTRMLHDDRLQIAQVTFIYVFVSVPLSWRSRWVAMLLNRGIAGCRLPLGLLPAVAAGQQRRHRDAVAQIFGADGLVNRSCGRSASMPPWLDLRPEYALWTLIVLNVWTFGSPMVIFLAGLRQIPGMYYEAAAVDGARQVDASPDHPADAHADHLLQPGVADHRRLPGVHLGLHGLGRHRRPGGLHAVLHAVPVPGGFRDFQMGYAAAMAWLLWSSSHFTAINFSLSKYWVFYDD